VDGIFRSSTENRFFATQSPIADMNRGHLITYTRTSPKATGISNRTFVDAATAFDEISQRLIQVLVHRRIPQDS
jgi:hypothetical protein